MGEEDSKAVLRMSALMLASMEFITKESKLIVALAELVEANNEQQSYFYHPELNYQPNAKFQLAQSQEGPSDPPDARQYFNGWNIAQEMVNGALSVGGVGVGAGTAIGNIVPGAGTLSGGIIGGIIGAVAGSSSSGYMEFAAQLSEYTQDVNNWCDDPINYSHIDYDKIYGSGDSN